MYIYPKTFEKVIDQGSTRVYNINKDFKKFIEENQDYFEPIFPIDYVVLKGDGIKTQYNVYCLLHYFLNKNRLDAGLKPVRSFKDDIKAFREVMKIEESA